MDTPIVNFIDNYINKNPIRLHMPGHKGKELIGVERLDLTEIDGADDLFHANGIIEKSQANASELFGAHTFYSTEGSSLSIKAMLFLAVKYAREKGLKPLILAGRNAHKSFLNASALIGFDVEWLFPKDCNYLSCSVTADDIKDALTKSNIKPCAVYITSPDYLGNVADIKGISEVCVAFDIPLLVDNAHGAYLKFLSPSQHPIDLGATACCDSAHKTLPALTGGAYLHLSKNAPSFFKDNCQTAMSLFGSTSPSYLILQSLDAVNKYIYDEYKEKLSYTVRHIEELKRELIRSGFSLVGNEKLKITLDVKKIGYVGSEFNEILKKNDIFVEFYDPDYITMMFTPQTSESDFEKLKSVLTNVNKKAPIDKETIKFHPPKKALSIRDAVLSPSETIDVNCAEGRIVSIETVSCPPAVPIVVSGEVIDKNAIACFNYYKIKTCLVVK